MGISTITFKDCKYRYNPLRDFIIETNLNDIGQHYIDRIVNDSYLCRFGDNIVEAGFDDDNCRIILYQLITVDLDSNIRKIEKDKILDVCKKLEESAEEYWYR